MKYSCLPVLYCVLGRFSHARLFATLRTVVHQAPLSMGFSRQDYMEWVAMPSSGGLLDPEIEPESVTTPALAGRFFTTSPTWKDSRSIIFISGIQYSDSILLQATRHADLLYHWLHSLCCTSQPCNLFVWQPRACTSWTLSKCSSSPPSPASELTVPRFHQSLNLPSLWLFTLCLISLWAAELTAAKTGSREGEREGGQKRREKKKENLTA